jgi:hypothetical protein
VLACAIGSARDIRLHEERTVIGGEPARDPAEVADGYSRPQDPGPGATDALVDGQPTHRPTEQPEESAGESRPQRVGRIRRQDPATARPRPTSLAEKRAIAIAQKREDEAQARDDERASRSSRIRRRVIAAAVVAIVIVVVFAVAAALGSSDGAVTASCVDEQNVVVDDSYCDTSTPGTYGTPGGLVILGGHSYRYYYGGTAIPGRVASGGSTVAPKKAQVTTRSGRTIQRGGLGVGGDGTRAGSKGGSSSVGKVSSKRTSSGSRAGRR